MDMYQFTRYQQQVINNIFENTLLNLNVELSQQLRMKIDDQQMINMMMIYFLNRHLVTNNELLSACLYATYNGPNMRYSVDCLVNTINGENIIGRLLRNQDCKEKANYYMNTIKMVYRHSQKTNNMVRSLSDTLLSQKYQQTVIDQVAKKYERTYDQRMYLKDLIKVTVQKIGRVMRQTNSNQDVNKKEIDDICQVLIQMDGLGIKELTMKSLYNYINQNVNQSIKKSCYRLIKYLMEISETEFVQKFSIHNALDIMLFLTLIQRQTVTTLQELRMKATIVKFVENSMINLEFSNQLQLKDFDDNIVIDLTDNLGKNLTWIGSSQQFVIIRRLSDNLIDKWIVCNYTKWVLAEKLQYYQGNQEYDMIINQDGEYNELNYIRTRHLQK